MHSTTSRTTLLLSLLLLGTHVIAAPISDYNLAKRGWTDVVKNAASSGGKVVSKLRPSLKGVAYAIEEVSTTGLWASADNSVGVLREAAEQGNQKAMNALAAAVKAYESRPSFVPGPNSEKLLVDLAKGKFVFKEAPSGASSAGAKVASALKKGASKLKPAPEKFDVAILRSISSEGIQKGNDNAIYLARQAADAGDPDAIKTLKAAIKKYEAMSAANNGAQVEVGPYGTQLLRDNFDGELNWNAKTVKNALKTTGLGKAASDLKDSAKNKINNSILSATANLRRSLEDLD